MCMKENFRNDKEKLDELLNYLEVPKFTRYCPALLVGTLGMYIAFAGKDISLKLHAEKALHLADQIYNCR